MILPTVSAIIMDFVLKCSLFRLVLIGFVFVLKCRVCRLVLIGFVFVLKCSLCRLVLIGFVFVLKCSLCRLVLIRFVHGGVSRRYTRNRLYCVLPIYFRYGLFLHF